MELLKRFWNWLTGKPAPRTADAAGKNPVRRPKILISGGDLDSKSVAAMVTQIITAGGDPVVVADHAERLQKRGDVKKIVAEDLAGVDALIVMGNNGDIDPAKYGKPKHEKTTIETNPARAAYEETVLKAAMEMGMPVLGVCGGMQRINVLGGGTLHQHVPDLVGDNHHAQGDQKIAPFVPVQFVKIQEGTALAAIAGSLPGIYTPQHAELPPGVIMENSFHHQAVDKVRGDFRVSAVSDDGIIEAIESPSGQTLGVQWHPEFGASDLGAKLAVHMVEKARAYGKNRTQESALPARQAAAIPGPMAARILAQRQNAVLCR